MNKETALAIRDRWVEAVSDLDIAKSDHARVLTTFQSLVEGSKWSGVVESGGLTRAEFCYLRTISKPFNAIAKEVLGIAEASRQLEREEAAHERAVNGPEVPIVSPKGEVTWYNKPSDDLMKVLLKAGDPGKYGNEKDAAGFGPRGPVINFNIGIPTREPQISTTVVEVKPKEEPAPPE